MDIGTNAWIWIFIILTCIFALGFCIGRFGCAWKNAKYPVVGTLFVRGKEFWVNFEYITSLSELKDHEVISLKVGNISAEKPSGKME